MKLFDVYPLFDIEIKSGKGCYTYDTEGNEYLDLYGGHAVISIGHSHPYYINKITEQAGMYVGNFVSGVTFTVNENDFYIGVVDQ